MFWVALTICIYATVGVVVFWYALKAKNSKRLRMIESQPLEVRAGVAVMSVVLWPLVLGFSITR